MLCFVTMAGAAIRPAQPGIGGGGSTVSGSITGAYSFNGPFSTVNATNVYLNAGISNLAVNLPVTNKFNSWSFWISPTVTNSYFAENRGLGIITNSTDFGALMQSILNRGTDGFHFQLFGNPYYNAHFVVSNTVVFTNWGTIHGDGNPSTVVHGKSGMTTPVFQVGDATHFVSGINRFEDLRMEGEGTSAGSVGVKIVNGAEPVFVKVEFTGFLLAGIQLSTLYNVAWGEAEDCWFVQKGANAHGILIDVSPTSAIDQNHFKVRGCTFGNHTAGGTGITVSNWFPGLAVLGNHFRNYTGAAGMGVRFWAGGDAMIQGNQFHNPGADWPITFADRGSATNYNTSVIGNKGWTYGGNGQEMVYVGTFVQGLTFVGNEWNGATASYIEAGNNGFINNFDKYQFRLGSISRTNALVYLDSSGIMQPVTLSGLTFSAPTLTASGGVSATNANQFGASTTLSIKDGALLTNTSIRTALTLPTLTVSRAALVNSSGQLTNSAAVSDVELEYLDGVTSAIQTQLGSKQAGSFILTNFIAMGITNIVSANANTVITTNAGVLTLTTAGTGSPGGSSADIQFNQSGSFAGTNTLTYDRTNNTLTAGSFIGSGTATPYLLLSSPNGASFALSVNTNRTIQTSNTLDFSTLAANDVIKMHSGSAGINVLTNGPASRVTPVVVAGVGTPSTNFTWLSTQQEISLTTTANVFIASVTGFDAAVVDYWACVITNGSGTNRTLGFSAGTNNWRFNGVYGTNAPSVITNNTRIEISGRQHGTNTQVVYGYTPWP